MVPLRLDVHIYTFNLGTKLIFSEFLNNRNFYCVFLENKFSYFII